MVRPPTARRFAFLQREDGQDALEYLLVIGGVSAAVVVAIVVLSFAVPSMRSATCDAIGIVPGYSGLAGCLGSGGSGSPASASGGTGGASGSPPIVQPTGTPLPQCAPGNQAGAPDCVRR